MTDLFAPCMQLTGRDANAVLLLMCVVYAWIARPAAEWCAETGLSLKQYYRAVAKLRQLGLVATEQHLFGDKNITHLRLVGAALELLPAKAQPGAEVPGQPGLASTGKPVPAGNGNRGIPKTGKPTPSDGTLASRTGKVEPPAAHSASLSGGKKPAGPATSLGGEEPTPPASGNPGIPKIGHPAIGKVMAGGQLSSPGGGATAASKSGKAPHSGPGKAAAFVSAPVADKGAAAPAAQGVAD
jgi:hypothetical protein